MRWANLLFCLFLAFAFAGGSTPLFASDLKSPHQSVPDDDRAYSDEAPEEELVAFCYAQRQICRKVCRLRFRDDQIGCPQSCDSREVRCGKIGCFKWREPELVIAERFGGFECHR
jgi:hypothetical protein